RGPINHKQLHLMTGISESAISKMISRCKGWIRRGSRNIPDGTKAVVLTQSGHEMLNALEVALEHGSEPIETHAKRNSSKGSRRKARPAFVLETFYDDPSMKQ